MVKRKLNSAVDGSSVDRKILNRMRLYVTCEKSRGLHHAMKIIKEIIMIIFLIIISSYIGFLRINLLNSVLCVQCTDSFIRDVASLLSHQFNLGNPILITPEHPHHLQGSFGTI